MQKFIMNYLKQLIRFCDFEFFMQIPKGEKRSPVKHPDNLKIEGVLADYYVQIIRC